MLDMVDEGDDGLFDAALHFLDHGAYELMLVALAALPADLKGEGEYLATGETWIEVFEGAGIKDFAIARVPPEEIGFRVLRGIRAA